MVALAAVCDCRLVPHRRSQRRRYKGLATLRAELIFHSAVIDAPLQCMIFGGDFFG